MGKKVIAMILAGGAGTRLDILSNHRAKPAVPFAGKYRIIDFVLSNCINSNIYTVGVLTQYLPRSLSDHIGVGKPWDLDRSYGGITLLPPYQRTNGKWYVGTANAVYQNLNYIADYSPEYVLILAGDHVYKMDYRDMIKQHEETDADITIAVKKVDRKIAHHFGILSVDENKNILEFEEKPENPKSELASMGIYIFKFEVLKDLLLNSCGPNGKSDFGKDIIPENIGKYNIKAFEFKGYWKDVGTLDQYWKTNLELISEKPPIDIYEEHFMIRTKSEERPPVKFIGDGRAKNSLISNGCVIKGYVENSVISPGVVVEKGAIIKNSIILNDTVIAKNAYIDKAIIDKKVYVGENSQVGIGENMTPNKEIPDKLYSGLNVIGKFARIPANMIIERNCRIMSKVEEIDFIGIDKLKSGETIHRSEENGFFDLFL